MALLGLEGGDGHQAERTVPARGRSIGPWMEDPDVHAAMDDLDLIGQCPVPAREQAPVVLRDGDDRRRVADLDVQHGALDVQVVGVAGERVRRPGQAVHDPGGKRRMGRPVGVDVVRAARLDAAGERGSGRDDRDGADQELERAAVAPQGAPPRPEVAPRPAPEPVPLRGEHRPRPAPDDRHPLDERGGTGLQGRLGFADEGVQVDVDPEPLELEHLVEDEGLGQLREPGHDVGDAQWMAHQRAVRERVMAARSPYSSA